MGITFLDWVYGKSSDTHVFLDRKQLTKQVIILIGRTPTFDELDNLETQIERHLSDDPTTPFILTTDWVSMAILNTNI